MKYNKDIYLEWNPFEGDRDTDIKVYEWKMVKTRKIHDCCLSLLVGDEYHEIPSGELAMREHAIVDGEWESTYSCISCMDIWLEELERDGYFK